MSTHLPLYPYDVFGEETGLLLGLLLGIGFGFVLERAGFGRARNLAAQFYLTDTRVLKVMFSAIVTAAVGMALLGSAGILDLSRVSVPETFLWPQLLGGLLLGVGFIVSGYCPGTAAVATVSGNVDGIASLFGILLGSLLFGFTFVPAVERFYRSGAMGVVRIQDLLGVPIAIVALAVVAMAVGAFLGGEALERIFAPRAGRTAPESPARVKRLVFAGMAGFALVAVLLTAAVAPRRAVAITRAPETIAPLGLARELVATPERYVLLDLRGGSVAARLPGALPLPPGDAEAAIAATLPATRTLVVYAQGDVVTLPPGIARFGGKVAVLAGGFDAWQRQVLDEPAATGVPAPASPADERLRAALRSRFTGLSAAPVSVDVRKVAVPAAAVPRKGGGC